jgi:hypothetical protein
MVDFFDKWTPHFGTGILARFVLALMYSGAYIYMSITGIDPGQAFVAVTTAVVLWFFKAGDEAESRKSIDSKQQEVVELARQLPPESGSPRS